MTKKTRSIALAAAAIALSFTLGACSSKKKTEDNSAAAAAAIESTPMNFNPAGSDSGQVNGLATIHFDYDKSSLTSEAKKQLKANAEWLKKNDKANLQIEGHCDARGSIEYNLSLGERRAKTVKDYLVSLGLPSARLSVISYGKEKPIASGDTDADYAKNRRANFVPLKN